MTYEETVASKGKRFLIGFLGFWIIVFGIAATCWDFQIFYVYLLMTPLMLITLIYKKKIILTVNNGEATLFLNSGPVSLVHVSSIYIYRKILNSRPRSSGIVPVNILQLISDKEDIITEIVLIDDDETYKIAYWMQSILKVNIDDYMGRELEIIPPQ